MTTSNPHRWRETAGGDKRCIGCKLVVYRKRTRNGRRAQLWARWPDGVARQIGWEGSNRRLASLGACPVVVEITPPKPKPRGGDMWQDRSRSARAIALLVEHPELTQTEVAAQVGITPQAVSMALKRRKRRRRKKASP